MNAPEAQLIVHLGLDAQGIKVGGSGVLDRRAPNKHLLRRIGPALCLIVLLADDLHRDRNLTGHGAIGTIDPGNLIAGLERVVAGADIGHLAVDKELPVFPGTLVNLLGRKRHVLFERRGQRIEEPTVRARASVGANTDLLKDLLGKIGGSCALFHQRGRRLRPRLLST